MMEGLVDFFLLAMLAVTALALLKLRNLFAVAMLAGIYSLLSAGLFTTLDAVDVAFTEAAVGAGISTILVLGTLALVGHEQKKSTRSSVIPLLVVFVTGSILVYGSLDMPPYGDPGNPVHHHVAPHYLEESEHEIGIPNVVTSVLASYRGYDTMGETTVIFTAMVGVLLLMGGIRKRVASGGPDGGSRPVPTHEGSRPEATDDDSRPMATDDDSGTGPTATEGDGEGGPYGG
jgi:multicomponent Na+:H+ antiporter subunit B